MSEWRLILDYVVPGTPQPKPRPRAGRRGGRTAIYDDRRHPSVAYREAVAFAAGAARHRARVSTIPADTPVRVDLDLVFERRRSLFRLADSEERIYKATKPDRDNCEKLQLDAMTAAGLWSDDGVVCAGEVRKWWGAILDRKGRRSEAPHVRVRVSVLADR